MATKKAKPNTTAKETQVRPAKVTTPRGKLHPHIDGFQLLVKDWMPDWRDAGKYEMPFDIYFERRMAWEFLRRNRSFQHFCQSFEHFDATNRNGPKPQAEDWGLTFFHSYQTDFIKPRKESVVGSWGSPSWCFDDSPDVFGANFKMQSREKYRRTLELTRWQVAAVFDLNQKYMSAKMIKAQLAYLESELVSTLNRISTNTPTTDRLPKHSRETLATALRVSDALAQEITRYEIGTALYEEKHGPPVTNYSNNPELDPYATDRAKDTQPFINIARHLIYEKGYLQLIESGYPASH